MNANKSPEHPRMDLCLLRTSRPPFPSFLPVPLSIGARLATRIATHGYPNGIREVVVPLHLFAINVPVAIPVVGATSATRCSNLSFHLLNLQAPCALRPNRKRFGNDWHPIDAATRVPVATVGPYVHRTPHRSPQIRRWSRQRRIHPPAQIHRLEVQRRRSTRQPHRPIPCVDFPPTTPHHTRPSLPHRPKPMPLVYRRRDPRPHE